MTTDILRDLHQLATRLDRLTDDAAQKGKDNRVPAQGAYWLGCAFGLETARDQLARILAEAATDTHRLDGG